MTAQSMRLSAGKRRSARAATMLEVLVVVTIGTVAIALTLPAVKTVAAKARQGGCINNQRIIARGLRWYHDDYGSFPWNYGWYYGSGSHLWALGYLSPYVGGPTGGPYGEGDLRGLEEGEFPAVYVCPGADKEAVFAHNVNTNYHACYWTNLAIRVNMGWMHLFSPYTHWEMPPGWDVDSAGEARFWGKVCPNYETGHWRSVYHPRLDTIANPEGFIFTGDTRNTKYVGYGHTAWPGEWHMRPGWGRVHGSLGFDRHKGKIMVGYVDGHARALPADSLVDTASYWYWTLPERELTGDFMLMYTGEDGCAGTRIHTLPDAVVN